MSTSATPIAASSSPRSLDAGGDEVHQRAVVEGAGQGVLIGRVEERRGLAGDPALGGTKDEVQDDRRDQTGRDRQQDDVAPDRLEAREDGRRVAPDTDDGADLAVGDEREVFAHDVRRVETGADRLAGADLVDRGRRGLAAPVPW